MNPRHEAYRRAVKRMYPKAKLEPMATISEDAEQTGGFMTIAVWVPRERMEKELKRILREGQR